MVSNFVFGFCTRRLSSYENSVFNCFASFWGKKGKQNITLAAYEKGQAHRPHVCATDLRLHMILLCEKTFRSLPNMPAKSILASNRSPHRAAESTSVSAIIFGNNILAENLHEYQSEKKENFLDAKLFSLLASFWRVKFFLCEIKGKFSGLC